MSAIPFTAKRERGTRFRLLQNATVKNIIDCKTRCVTRFLNRFLLRLIFFNYWLQSENSIIDCKRRLNAIPEACENIWFSKYVFNCIWKTRRVTRCPQHLKNASHVRHANGQSLAASAFCAVSFAYGLGYGTACWWWSSDICWLNLSYTRYLSFSGLHFLTLIGCQSSRMLIKVKRLPQPRLVSSSITSTYPWLPVWTPRT